MGWPNKDIPTYNNTNKDKFMPQGCTTGILRSLQASSFIKQWIIDAQLSGTYFFKIMYVFN